MSSFLYTPVKQVIAVCRATNRVPVDPYEFDAGHGPGIQTMVEILNLAKLAHCQIDAGCSPGPVYIAGLSHLNDEDLTALLQLAQVIP